MDKIKSIIIPPQVDKIKSKPKLINLCKFIKILINTIKYGFDAFDPGDLDY